MLEHQLTFADTASFSEADKISRQCLSSPLGLFWLNRNPSTDLDAEHNKSRVICIPGAGCHHGSGCAGQQEACLHSNSWMHKGNLRCGTLPTWKSGCYVNSGNSNNVCPHAR